MYIIPSCSDEVFPTIGVGARFFFAPDPAIVGFGAMGFDAPVLIFEFERNRAKKAGSSFAYIACQEEGTDVLTDAIVEVGIPTLSLVL